METYITLVLADGSTQKRFVIEMDMISSSTILRFQGDYYVYQFFKWAQKEIWFNRVEHPLTLPSDLKVAP